MALDLAPKPFVWGEGGEQLTPEEIARRRLVAQSMITQGGDYSPIKSWTQGAARVTQAMLGGLMARDASEAEKANRTAEGKLLSDMFSVAAPATPSAPVAPTAAPAVAPANPNEPWMGTPPAGPVTPPSLSDAIAKVSAARGVDPKYMTRLALVESGGDPNAASDVSSARGPFQFIKSTAAQYGLTNPNDVASSTDAAARFTLDNKAALTKALGREPTQGELYLAHQQGAGGAAKLLANPDAPAVSIVGRDAVLNNGGTADMTAGQFAQKWSGRFDGAPAAPAAPAAPSMGGMSPAMVQALTSPYVSEGTKRIAMLIMQNQLQSQGVTTVDLGNQVGIMDKRGNIIRQIPKGEPNKGPEFGIISEDEYGNKTYGWRDSRTQTTRPEPKPAAVAAPAAAPAAAPGAQAAPVIPPAPPGVNPKVWRDTVSREAAEAATGKLTADQSKMMKFGNRMEDAIANIEKLGDAVAMPDTLSRDNLARGLSSIPSMGVGAAIGNKVATDKYQQYEQAKSQFITAMLRDESGAAIGTPEYVRIERELFPVAGDGPEVLKQKAAARRVEMEGVIKAAGPSYKSPKKADSGTAPAGVDPKVWAAMTPEERALWK